MATKAKPIYFDGELDQAPPVDGDFFTGLINALPLAIAAFLAVIGLAYIIAPLFGISVPLAVLAIIGAIVAAVFVLAKWG